MRKIEEAWEKDFRAGRNVIRKKRFGIVPVADAGSMASPRVEIEYCTQCRWLLRAAWMAQELLTTFVDEIGELALVPGKGGVLEVRVDGETLFSRKEAGRFPELKEIKQLVRDRIAPDKSLGHSDAGGHRKNEDEA